LVEMRGIEPLSESALQGISPGAGSYLNSLAPAQAAMLRGPVASLFMVRAKLTARTCTTKVTPYSRLVVLPARMGSLSGYQF